MGSLIHRLTADGSLTASTLQSQRHQEILQDIESKLKDLEYEGRSELSMSESFSGSDQELEPSRGRQIQAVAQISSPVYSSRLDIQSFAMLL